MTYGTRLLLYVLIRVLSQQPQLPSILTVCCKSFLMCLNGGWSCAGPLDRNQPATELDLLFIPTRKFVNGMYPAEDALCAICCMEYTEGETLRILPCSHHFHQSCVDQWLMQKNTCPFCIQRIDAATNVRAASAAPDSNNNDNSNANVNAADDDHENSDNGFDRPSGPLPNVDMDSAEHEHGLHDVDLESGNSGSRHSRLQTV